MIPTVKAKLLEGKKGLVVGIANGQSIAWGAVAAIGVAIALGVYRIVRGGTTLTALSGARCPRSPVPHPRREARPIRWNAIEVRRGSSPCQRIAGRRRPPEATFSAIPTSRAARRGTGARKAGAHRAGG